MPSTNIKITATDKTKGAFNSARRNVDALKGSVNLLKSALVGYVSVAGARAFLDFTKRQRDMADAIGKTADRLGLSTDALQELSFGAEKAGMATSSFEMAMQRFTRRLAEAQSGTGVLKDTFKELGINLEDPNKRLKTAEELLGEVADKMAETSDQGERVKLAFKMFDSEGVKMVNMLQNGSKSLEVFKKELRKTGGIISEDFVRASEEANDRLTMMGRILDANLTKKLGWFNEAILDVSDSLLRFKGIDPTASMSLDRLYKVAQDLDVQISKTANAQRAWNKNAGVTKEVREMEVKKLGEVIQHLLKEQNLVLARIRDAKALANASVTGAELNEKNKKKELENLGELTQAEQDFHASKLSLAFETHAKEEKLLGSISHAQQKMYSSNLTLANSAKTKEQKLRDEIVEFRRTEEQQRTFDIMTEHERRLEVIKSYYGEEMASSEEANRVIVKQKLDTIEKLKAIDIEKRDSAIATSKDMIRSMGSANKSWFQANKALAIADTAMATFTGATKALAIPPPWVGIAYASTITGLGMANIARIKATKYEERAMGGRVNKGQSYIVGERGKELFTPNQSGNITPNNELGGVTNINFNIRANDARGFDALLQERRGMIVSMINKSLNERGRENLI